MPQAMRMARNANRHWVAAGFLASTSLFVLLMFVNWRDQRHGWLMLRRIALLFFPGLAMWLHRPAQPQAT
jgi:hypothetical protein